ncbi:MFS transporter [Candidatus Thorarchaeota archaeon]|nr:MAG: MFS transporter [Candidatus Thorarchaeota archaeon]
MTIMSRVVEFFGLTEGNEKVLSLAKTLALLFPAVALTIQLSTTFFMIFVAEALGNGSFIDGLTVVGILVVIQMVIQTLLDYPTGAIGDWIGQRYIITAAFLCFSAGFLMVSFVTSATPIYLLILVYVLLGLGNSQMSGAFNAWFDNNYRVAMPGDKDRKQYGVFMGKIGMLFSLIGTFCMIPGSILAVILGRAWVFQLQAIMCAAIAIAVMRNVKDFPDVEEAREDRPTLSEYTALLKEGIGFLFSDRFVTFLLLGGCVVMSVGLVWGELLLFPMYFSYLIAEVAVSSFRTILFIPGIFWQERSGVWAKRFEPEKWIPRFRLLQGTGFVFYLAFAAIMYLFPPVAGGAMITLTVPLTQITLLEVPVASVLPIVLIATTFTLTGIFGGLSQILTQRVLLDVVPNRIRNSMYSLSPTIATIIAIPQIALFGWLIPLAGFPLTMALCGLISLLGVMMIRKGLSYPKPTPTDEPGPIVSAPAPVPAE